MEKGTGHSKIQDGARFFKMAATFVEQIVI